MDLGHRDVGLGNVGMQELGDVGTQGRDKQTTPEFCTIFGGQEKGIMESLPVADDFQRPWSPYVF